MGEKKIAALGFRVSRGRCYHGLSLNVAMNLEPFRRINPCGFEGLQVTQLRDLGCRDNITAVSKGLLEQLMNRLDYPGIIK